MPPSTARRPAADRLVVAVRDRHVDARVAVGRRAEEEALLAEADAPGVVVGGAQELELRAVGLEAVEALAEAVLSRRRPCRRSRSSRRCRRSSCRGRSAGCSARRACRRCAQPVKSDLAHVGLVVAVGVLQEQRVAAPGGR